MASRKSSTSVAPTSKMEVGQVIDYGEHSGGGMENQTSADMAIPFLNVLQTNSPQVSKANKDKHIAGSEAGMFHNTVTNEVFDGESGLAFIPVLTEHCYVLWRPRTEGGGFVRKVDFNGSEAKQILASGKVNDKGIPLSTEGYEMKDTFYVYALALDENGDVNGVVVIPFVSTKIKAYRHYMSKLRMHKQLGKAPLYAHRARITTVGATNAHGDFFTVEINPLNDGDDPILASIIEPGDELLNVAREMSQSILDGQRTAAHDSLDGGEDEASGDGVF